MEVRYHPLFERWLTELADADEEVFGDVMALLTALEVHGRGLDDEAQEESHPVVTARHDMHALRRTPPSEAAPNATQPPVFASALRLLHRRRRRRDRGRCCWAGTRHDSATSGIRQTSPRPGTALTSTAATTLT